MSAGSCFMEKTSTVGPWTAEALREKIEYESFKQPLHIESAAELKEILKEQEEIWLQRERSQLEFVQKEHSDLLAKLHSEIERLQLRIIVAEASQNLSDNGVNSNSSDPNGVVNDLRSQLVSVKEELVSYRDLCATKTSQISALEQRLKDVENSYEIRLKALEPVKKPIPDLKAKATTVDVKAKTAAAKPIQHSELRKTVPKTIAKDTVVAPVKHVPARNVTTRSSTVSESSAFSANRSADCASLPISVAKSLRGTTSTGQSSSMVKAPLTKSSNTTKAKPK